MAHAPPGESYFRVHLPNGRNVDLLTNHGADAFVRAMPTFLQVNIQTTLDPIRARGGANPNPRDAQMLIQTYTMIGVVADHSSPQVFQEMMASDHMDLWVTHVQAMLQRLTLDPRWIGTGVLARHDQEMLDSLTPSCKHYGMVQRMLEAKLWHALANFIRARPAPQMPCAEVAETVCAITGNVQLCLQPNNSNNNNSEPVEGDDRGASDQAFRRLEDSGLLAQTLRCLTVPPATTPNDVSCQLFFLDELLRQSVQMRRKFKPSSPTGTILRAIVDGQDGHAQCPREIKKRINSLAQVLDYAASPRHDGVLTSQRSCRFCNKNAATMELMTCSRCKDTYYCSKECQRADWKAHKPACQLYAGKPTMAGASGMQNMVLNWVQRNYFLIMQDLDRATHLYNVPKSEVVLELDFYAKRGIAPALCTPSPIFEVGLTKDYLEGDRPDEPDWFFKGTDVYQHNIEHFLMGLRDHYQRMTSNHILTILRYPTGSSGVFRIQLDCAAGANKPMFSDAALEAFSQVMRDNNDDGSLDQAFTPDIARTIRAYRDQCRASDEEPSFQADMASIIRRAQAFRMSDAWKTEFGGSYSDDEDDNP